MESNRSGIESFFTDSNGADVNAGINYFPPPVADPCISSSYNPLQVALVAIPDNAIFLINSMQSQAANGTTTPIYSALLGSLQFAANHKDNNPTREVIVVLITDGDQYGCDSNTINEITTLVSSAYNYNGVRTYAIAVNGATIANLNSIASAGGTSQAYDITGDSSLLYLKMLEIRAAAVTQ